MRWIIGRVPAGPGSAPPPMAAACLRREHRNSRVPISPLVGGLSTTGMNSFKLGQGALRPQEVRPHPRPAGSGGDLDCRGAPTGRAMLVVWEQQTAPQPTGLGLSYGSLGHCPGSGDQDRVLGIPTQPNRCAVRQFRDVPVACDHLDGLPVDVNDAGCHRPGKYPLPENCIQPRQFPVAGLAGRDRDVLRPHGKCVGIDRAGGAAGWPNRRKGAGSAPPPCRPGCWPRRGIRPRTRLPGCCRPRAVVRPETMAPDRMIPILSDKVSASSWSCVTNMVVIPTSR